MLQSIKKDLIAGLIILLPIAVAVALLGFLIDLFTHPFVDFVSSLLIRFNITPQGFLFFSSEQIIRYTSKLLILICLFFIIVLLGILTRWFVLRSALSFVDTLLRKIPVINTIYKASQEIIKTVFKTDQTSFKQVVMVPFPHEGIYALGLVSREAPETYNRLVGSKMVSVLVPTTPNPTSGFLLMYDQKDLIYLDMKPEAAIKYILSCGVLNPESGKSA